MTRILCLGDSITDCGRLFSADPLGKGYVKQLYCLLHNTVTDFPLKTEVLMVSPWNGFFRTQISGWKALIRILLPS